MTTLVRLALPLFAGALLLGAAPFAPVPSVRAQAQDDEDEKEAGEDGDKDKKKKKPKPGDPEVKAALDELLNVELKLHEPAKIIVTYAFGEAVEEDDFKQKGFDQFQVGGAAGAQHGLTIAAGSRKLGRVQHVLPLTGDWTIKLEMQNFAIASNTILAFNLSKKVSVNFGQVICKTKSLKPYNKRARVDMNMLARERTNKLELVCKENTLKVKLNGRDTDERTFKKGELKEVKFGMTSRNTVVIFSRLEITGDVDASGL